MYLLIILYDRSPPALSVSDLFPCVELFHQLAELFNYARQIRLADGPDQVHTVPRFARAG